MASVLPSRENSLSVLSWHTCMGGVLFRLRFTASGQTAQSRDPKTEFMKRFALPTWRPGAADCKPNELRVTGDGEVPFIR